jgi:hypothetical protein
MAKITDNTCHGLINTSFPIDQDKTGLGHVTNKTPINLTGSETSAALKQEKPRLLLATTSVDQWKKSKIATESHGTCIYVRVFLFCFFS